MKNLEFIKYACQKETSLPSCENFDVIGNSIRYTNPIGTTLYTPEEFLELDRVKALLPEWEALQKTALKVRMGVKSDTIKVDTEQGRAILDSVPFFNWLCEYQADSAAGSHVWTHDRTLKMLVRSFTEKVYDVTRGDFYDQPHQSHIQTYQSFVESEIGAEYIAVYLRCLDNVKWTKPTPPRSNKDKFIYDSEIAFLDAEQREREEYINRLVETHKA
jgi:hypothetical protein